MLKENSIKSFKQQYSLEQRKAAYINQSSKDPDKIILIIEKHHKSRLPALHTKKFKCPKTYKFAMIKGIVMKNLEKAMETDPKNFQKSTSSIYIFAGKHVPTPETDMTELYEREKDEDGFLYITYHEMETFGGI